MPRCYLEGLLADGESVYRIPLGGFPALVGREAGLAVTLQSGNVSRRHAEFVQRHGRLMVRDLGSRNGTFLNHEKITEIQPVGPGDVLRFGDIELRLQLETDTAAEPADEFTATAFFAPDQNVDRMPIGARQLEQMLQERLIKPLYQPILSTQDERIKGLELLGRGFHQDLPEYPIPLFYLAGSLGRSVELSEVIREVGVRAWVEAQLARVPLFMNTHPQELKNWQRLAASLQVIRIKYPEVPLVLEIHEQAVTDHATLADLNDALRRMRIELAYDDFGAGQARLLELLDVPPYTVKFDISLIHDLDKVSRNRQEMIGLLVTLVKKGHTTALAEGVSNPGELTACRELGFDLVQGYVYGQPAALGSLAASSLW